MSALIFTTPCGREAMARASFRCTARGNSLPLRPFTSAAETASSGSTVPSSLRAVSCHAAAQAFASASVAGGRKTSAEASRGMALRLLPPSMRASRAPSPARSSSTRFRILTALPRPLSISIPEWPPLRPVTEISRPTSLAGTSSGVNVHTPVVSLPPEQPT